MKYEEFEARLAQIKQGPVPQRSVFIWVGAKSRLEPLLSDLEIHRADIVAASLPPVDNAFADTTKSVATYLNEICQAYEKQRREPSVLVVDNSILLARYSCDLSALFRFAISPRSAVVLIFPKESRKDLPPRTDVWVERGTDAIVTQIARQLGDTSCVIDISGGD